MNMDVIRLSVQRALLGLVTSNLRAVYIKYVEDSILLIFYYNTPPSEEELELSSLADTEFISDFPLPDYKTNCKIITLPYPEALPKEGVCVYLRYEGSMTDSKYPR